MGCWEDKQGSGVGSHSLPRGTNPDRTRPVNQTAGSWAPGRRATQRQPSVTSQRGHPGTEDSDCGAGTDPRLRGWTDSSQGLVRPADRGADRQIDSCLAVSHSARSRQTVCPRAPGVTPRGDGCGSARGGACHPCPTTCAGRGARGGGCGEQLPAGSAHRAAGSSPPPRSEKEVGGGTAPGQSPRLAKKVVCLKSIWCYPGDVCLLWTGDITPTGPAALTFKPAGRP